MSRRQSGENKNEEARGLFILGLLAVLITVKLQSPAGKLNITIGQLSADLMPILDNIIILWSLYAFFMVLGLSKDVIGKEFSSAFRELARSMLRLNFLLLAPFAMLYGYLAYPSRFPWLLGLISILVLFGAITIFIGFINKKPKVTKINLKENKATVMSCLILVFAAIILMYPDDWIRFPAFIAGALSILGYLVWHKEKKPESAKIDQYCT